MATLLMASILVMSLLLPSIIEGKLKTSDYASITCEDPFTRRIYQHTVTVYREGGPPQCQGRIRGLSKEEVDFVLDFHNRLRQTVANGKQQGQPMAGNMMRLVWDNEVAEIAQLWAEQCHENMGGRHDKCRKTKDNVKVGQNFAWKGGYGMAADRLDSIMKMIQGWFDEVYKFNPQLVDGYQSGGPVVGHYTAMVWAKTTHLGCGLLHLDQGYQAFDFILICNYKVTGNMLGAKIYERSDRPGQYCKKPSTKYEGLCEPSDEEDTPQSSPTTPQPSRPARRPDQRVSKPSSRPSQKPLKGSGRVPAGSLPAYDPRLPDKNLPDRRPSSQSLTNRRPSSRPPLERAPTFQDTGFMQDPGDFFRQHQQMVHDAERRLHERVDAFSRVQDHGDFMRAHEQMMENSQKQMQEQIDAMMRDMPGQPLFGRHVTTTHFTWSEE